MLGTTGDGCIRGARSSRLMLKIGPLTSLRRNTRGNQEKLTASYVPVNELSTVFEFQADAMLFLNYGTEKHLDHLLFWSFLI